MELSKFTVHRAVPWKRISLETDGYIMGLIRSVLMIKLNPCLLPMSFLCVSFIFGTIEGIARVPEITIG